MEGPSGIAEVPTEDKKALSRNDVGERPKMGFQKRLLKRWADVTSDEELSISFLKSQFKNPGCTETLDGHSKSRPREGSRWRLPQFLRKDSGGPARCVKPMEPLFSANQRGSVSTSIRAAPPGDSPSGATPLATTPSGTTPSVATPLGFTPSAPPTKASPPRAGTPASRPFEKCQPRPTQFPQGFVSVMNIVSGSSVAKSELESEDHVPTITPTTSSAVEKSAVRATEPLVVRKIPAAVLLSQRSASLLQFKQQPGNDDTFDSSLTMSLRCVPRQWCDEQQLGRTELSFRSASRRDNAGFENSYGARQRIIIGTSPQPPCFQASSGTTFSARPIETARIPVAAASVDSAPPHSGNLAQRCSGLTEVAECAKGALQEAGPTQCASLPDAVEELPSSAATSSKILPCKTVSQKEDATRTTSKLPPGKSTPAVQRLKLKTKPATGRYSKEGLEQKKVQHSGAGDPMPVKKSVITYRERQLAIEKSSADYREYIRRIPKDVRNEDHPQTPRVDAPISCGAFYKTLHLWRYRVRTVAVLP